MRSTRSRGWVFTVNNYTDDDIVKLRELSKECSYLVFGYETAPTTGTPHLQGFARFHNPISGQRARSIFRPWYVECQRGTPYQAAEYCKKGEKFEEFGEAPTNPRKPTTQEKWGRIIKLCEEGDISTIRAEFPYVYFAQFKRIRELRERRVGIMSGALQNEWWVGPTGTGKSRHLWSLYPEHYQKSLNKWWDGYDNQETVALEEMDPDHGSYLGHFIKIWADRYPFSPEIKGGSLRNIRPRRLIILSNYTIDECFSRIEDRDPIKRRFKVVHFPTSIFPSEEEQEIMVESLLGLSQ